MFGMSPSNGMCTFTKVKSLSSSMACNSGVVMLVYDPPSTEIVFPTSDGSGETPHAAEINVTITGTNFNTLVSLLFLH